MTGAPSGGAPIVAHRLHPGIGYEPEDSFGFCPNYEHNRIYFAWRKR